MLYIDIFTPAGSSGFQVHYDALQRDAEESAAEDFCSMTTADIEAVIDQWLPE